MLLILEGHAIEELKKDNDSVAYPGGGNWAIAH